VAGTESLFVLFGAAVIVGTLLVVLRSYLSGRDELFSARNFFLVGIIVYLGIGYIDVGMSEQHWSNYSRSTCNVVLLGGMLFWLGTLLCMRYMPSPKYLSNNFLSKWPNVSGSMVLFVIIACSLIALVPVFVPGYGFLQRTLQGLGRYSIFFAATFAFWNWYRNKLNLFNLGIMVVVLLYCVAMGVLYGHGRKPLLALGIMPMLVAYWCSWRYKSKTAVVFKVSIAAFAVLLLIAGYSTMRFYHRGKEQRTIGDAVAAAKSVTPKDAMAVLGDIRWFAAQRCVDWSLYMHHVIMTNQADPSNFHTFKVILSHPIPRSSWPDKPRTIGMAMIQDIARWEKVKSTQNTGIGIVGHGIHEGGIYMLIVFAGFATLLVRVFDDPLKRHPENPFLMSMLVGASSFLLGWTRGDIAFFTIQIIEIVLLCIVLKTVCRMIFGTANSNVYGQQAMGQYVRGYGYPPGGGMAPQVGRYQG